jgi:lipopolysaccharide assembly protein A
VKTISNILASGIIASWIAFFAVFSIQNIGNVSLQFLSLRSIDIPIGVLLAFIFGFGTVIGSCLPIFFTKSPKIGGSSRSRSNDLDDPLENWDE